MKKANILLALFAILVLVPTARAQNNAALQGDYAFTFNGMTTGGGTSWTPFAAVGRFTADGAGNLTNGELDTNGFTAAEKLLAQAFTGTYSIGADNRGLMNLNIPGGGVLAFAMTANGNAKFVTVDASGGHGTVGSGTIEKVDTSAYGTAKITGDYAFGVTGFDQSNNRTAVAGRFTANGLGVLSDGAADINLAGNFSTWNLFVGGYAITDGTSGRGILNLPPLVGGTPTNLNFVFYVVNSGRLFAMEMDALTPATPLLNGTVVQQQGQLPLLGYSNASLHGKMVMYGAGTGGAEAGELTADGLGTLEWLHFANCFQEGGGNGTYSVASNGRTTIRFGPAYVAVYLVNTNQAFYVAAGGCVSAGAGEPQAPEPLTNSAISGVYAGSTAIVTGLNNVIFSGVFTADGASPTGTISGTEDIGAPSGASLGTPATATYSIPINYLNGFGTMSQSITGSGNSTDIVFVISSSKFVVIASGLLIFEK